MDGPVSLRRRQKARVAGIAHLRALDAIGTDGSLAGLPIELASTAWQFLWRR